MAINLNTPSIYTEGEEDNLEILSDLEEFLGDNGESREENKYAVKVSPRLQKLRDIRKSAKVSISQSSQFLASVELDIKRKAENVLLIEELYIHWCSHGNKLFLSMKKFFYFLTANEVLSHHLCKTLQNLRNKIFRLTHFCVMCKIHVWEPILIGGTGEQNIFPH